MRIALSSEVLEWALQRSNRRESLENKFPKVSEWLSGAIQPTLRQLEDFAKAAAVPFGYLLLPEPPEERLSITHFRTRGNGDVRSFSPDLLETVQKMQQRQAWMREYLMEQGHDRLPFVNSVSSGDDPVFIAKQIRKQLGIGEEWANIHSTWTDALRSLENKVEAVGILVMVNGVVGNNNTRKLNPQEFRGFVLVDDYAPLVFINGADGKAAQMFTLAHELAHIWLGLSASFDLRELQPANDVNEKICDSIAAEFLVPQHSFRALWESVKDRENPYGTIARRFKVSEIVAARRALDLGFIGRDEFFDFYDTNMNQRRVKSSPGGDFYATQSLRIGRRFGQALVGSVQEGKTLYTDAYRLTGIYGKTFRQYAQEVYGRTL